VGNDPRRNDETGGQTDQADTLTNTERIWLLKVEKFKQKATICFSTEGSLDVHFFLAYHAENHSGAETILDVLNSEKTFIPLEDIFTNEILLIGKTEIMYLSLSLDKTMPARFEAVAIPVKVELLNGEIMEGKFLTDLPPDKLRLSDFLNYTPQFISLWRDDTNLILNKAYILSVKHAE
jgi:hypothetical protein